MRRLSILAAAALLAGPAIAQAAEPPCLTPAEFTSLSSYALPSIISGTTERCATTLSADAFLPKNGKDLATRYGQNKSASWPGAKAAFIKLAGTDQTQAAELMKGMPDGTLRQLFDSMISGIVSQQIPLQRCDTIDRVVRLLSPLPPENTAELIGLAVGLGSKTGAARFGKVSICEA